MAVEATSSSTNSGLEHAPENRRGRVRFPIFSKIIVTPSTEHSTLLGDEAFIAFGKDISRSGICFTHESPLTHQRFFLSFHASEFGEFVIEVEVVQSRFTAIGLYESGCRMLRKVVVPAGFRD